MTVREIGDSDVPPAAEGWEVTVGEVVIGRGWSWKPDPLRRSAERDYLAKTAAFGTPPDCYSISVFGLRRKANETTDRLVSRILTHMRDHGVRAKYAALVTASELEVAGFELRLSEPPPDHYDLHLGLNLDELRVEELSRLFNIRERRRMPQ